MFRSLRHYLSFRVVSIITIFNITLLPFLSCSKSGEKNNNTTSTPSVTYNASTLQTTTDGTGQVTINSKVNGHNCQFDISVKNQSGVAVQNAKVTYNQSGDKVFIFVRDNEKKYNPVIVYGTTAEIQSRFGETSLSSTQPNEPFDITQPNIIPLVIFIPFIVTAVSLYYAEYKIYKSAYNISQLLISNYQGEGPDYRVYCLTPAEIGQLQAERVGMTLDASGMLLDIVGVNVAWTAQELFIDLTERAAMGVATNWRDDLVKKLVAMGYSDSDPMG